MTKTFKRILASSLAIACTVIAGVTAFATNAFGLFGETAQTEQVNHNQQTVFGNFFGNGMKITASAEESMSSTWYVNDGIEDYSAYDMAVNVNAPGFIYVSSTITESLQNHPINAIRVVENASGTFKLFKTTTLPTTGSVFNGELIEVASMTFTGDSSKITTHTFPEFTLNAGEYLVFGTPGTAWFKCQYNNSSLPVVAGFESYSRVGNSAQAVSIVAGANLGIKVGYVSQNATTADGSARLTASISPATASNKKVDWSVEWVNPSSTWASGKTVTDYVSVTPTADGALTADVTCKKAFGEQVQVTVTSRENTSISASCTVDYAQRVTAVSFSIHAITGNDPVNHNSSLGSSVSFMHDLDVPFKVANVAASTVSEYTISDTYTATAKMYMVDTYTNDMYSYCGFSWQPAGEKNVYNTQIKILDLIQNGSTLSTSSLSTLKSFIGQYPEKILFKLEVTLTGTYSTYTQTFDIDFKEGVLAIPVENVSLDSNSIIL